MVRGCKAPSVLMGAVPVDGSPGSFAGEMTLCSSIHLVGAPFAQYRQERDFCAEPAPGPPIYWFVCFYWVF